MNAHTAVTDRLALASIRTDGGTQSRAQLYHPTVSDYVEVIASGVDFPAVVVFFDGKDYWLADGFHRHAAYASMNRKDIAADVHQGTRRDAILYSVGANSSHGLRRTSEDKRRAVTVLLNDPEWSGWSDREVARQCRVSHPFVAKFRPSLTGNVSSEPRTYTDKHGNQSRMNTSNIGRGSYDESAVDKAISDLNHGLIDRSEANSRIAEADPNWSTRDQPKAINSSKLMDPKALWIWGRLKDFERDGILTQSPEHLLNEMTQPMRGDVRRLLPLVREFIEDLETIA